MGPLVAVATYVAWSGIEMRHCIVRFLKAEGMNGGAEGGSVESGGARDML